MAISKNGILGGFSGKVGNIVGVQLNGEHIVRAAPRPSKKPATEKQKRQRLKFALAVQFTKPFLFITNQFFANFPIASDKKSLIISYASHHVVKIKEDEFYLDWSKFLLSSGDLAGFHYLDFRIDRRGLLLTWKDNTQQAYAQAEDKIYVAIASESLQQVLFLEDIAQRSSLQALVALPDWTMEETSHVYVFMSNPDKTQCCNSFYLGALINGEFQN